MRQPIQYLLLILLTVPVRVAPAAPEGHGRQYETRHYKIWTDVDHELARDLAMRMDAMYDEYMRRFAGIANGNQEHERHTVFIFARKSDYSRFTEDRFPNTGGIFIPSRRILAAYLEGQGRDGLRRTLQHEAFHQFAHSVVGPNVPIWLNEGIAQVFEEGIWTGDSFIIAQVPPRRIRQLQKDMRERRLIEFKRLLAMTDDEWARGMRDRTTGAAQYNQAWAMAHFLIYASDPSGNPLYRARVIHMLKLLRDGTAADAAFRRAFSDNVVGFQQRFVEYAQHLAPTVEATYIEYQGILADMLTALRSEGRTFDSIDEFRQRLQAGGYRLQYSQGWSTAEDVRVYFTDPKGRLMNSSELFFRYRRGAPLPDIVCRALDGLQLQTRFYASGDSIEHEVVAERRR